jgi:hypothetical protein
MKKDTCTQINFQNISTFKRMNNLVNLFLRNPNGLLYAP